MPITKVKITADASRGTGNPQDIFTDIMNQAYDNLKSNFDECPANEQNDYKVALNDIQTQFGDEFYTGKDEAEAAWTDVTPENKPKITDYCLVELVELDC